MIEVYPTMLEGFCTVTIDLTGRYTNTWLLTGQSVMKLSDLRN